MILNLSKDINGNKLLKVSFRDGTRGFSIQTLSNLPRVHKMTKYCFNQFEAKQELNAYIKEYGTKRQKELLGW